MQYLKGTEVRQKNYHHHLDWSDCKKCNLFVGRKNACLWRGFLPCEILFIGEAPGDVENSNGLPFTGPAGNLLRDIINYSRLVQDFSYCLTNLVACHPEANRVPQEEEIESCYPRLLELIKISKCTSIILVGDEAEKHLKNRKELLPIPKKKILHPSAILRQDQHQKLVSFRMTATKIINAVKELV